MLPMNLLPILPMNRPSLPQPTTTRSHSPHDSLSMLQGKSSQKRPPAARRNHSPLHHAWGSTSSAMLTAPSRMQSRSPRGWQLRSRIGRTSTTSTPYSMRSRSPSSENEARTALMTTTILMMTTPVSQQLQLGSPSMPATSQMPPSRPDKTLVNWPNGSDASLMGGLYSTLRTMGLEINPMPSNYLPPSISPMRPQPRASPDGFSRPLPAPQLPFTPSTQLPRPPLTGAYTQSSSITESLTRRPRLSTIASATSRQR